MADKVKGFLLYADQYEPISDLSLEQKGMLLDAIFQYQRNEELVFSDPVVKAMFGFFKQQFMRDREKYESRCEKARESIRKRWNTNVNEGIQTNTNVSSRNGSNTNHTDNDTDNDTDKDINTPLPPKKSSRFVPPTVEEVEAYCMEHDYRVDPLVFVDFYAAKGWMIGKNKMKDWHAAVRIWVQKQAEISRRSAIMSLPRN